MRIALLGSPDESLFRLLESTANDTVQLVPCEIQADEDVAALFERAHEFDLIHSLDGPSPLAFARLVETPVVCTIKNGTSAEDLDMFRRYNADCVYVSDRENPNLRLQFAEFIPTDDESDAGSRYHKLYERVILNARREDHRPWGFYEVLSDRADHKVKRITVYPGKRLSLQRHQRREEHWFFIEGEAVVTIDDREIPVKAGEAVDIPLRAVHRVANPGSVV